MICQLIVILKLQFLYILSVNFCYEDVPTNVRGENIFYLIIY